MLRLFAQFRQRHEFGIAVVQVLLCAAALVWVWVPSEPEKDSFREIVINEPAIGRWLYTVEDLRKVRDEVKAIEKESKGLSQSGRYTAERQHQLQVRLIDLEKSLAPVGGGIVVPRGGVSRAWAKIVEEEVGAEAAMLYRSLQIEIRRVSTEAVGNFQRSTDSSEWDKAAKLNEAAGLFRRTMRPVVDTNWNPQALGAWVLKTHIESMLVVFLLFVLRAELVGQRRKILLLDAHKTAFWMFLWPVGIWRYPTSDPVEFVRLVRARLALVVTAFFAVATPNYALAQSKAENKKKRDDNHTLVLEPSNSMFVGLQLVDKYHGMVVGEIFVDDPAPRLMARYTRKTPAGNFYVDSWNSFGSGFNAESDIGVGYSRAGFDFSYTRFMVRGGDIHQFSASKLFAVNTGYKSLPLNVNLLHYRGTDKTSPPGGTVLRIGSSFSHSIWSGFQFSHQVTMSADNNPFGLGDGDTVGGFYTGEVSYKKFYAAVNVSQPLVGRDNTSRGFRRSFAIGYRHAFAW